MAGFTIRVEEDGGERRWVRAELGEDCTLGRLADWLADAFQLAPGPWSFTLAGRRPGEDASYAGPGDDVGRPGEDVEVGALAWRAGSRWVHRSAARPFRAREIRVEAVSTSPSSAVEVRELERGAAGRAGELDAERMAARVVQAAESWRRELEEDVEPAAAALRERGALALEVARWIGEDPDRQEQLELLADGEGLEWAVDLPSCLGAAGLHEQALALCEALRFVRGDQETRAERPFLLLGAGRADEARALAESWIADAREDGWAWLLTGDLLAQMGETDRARRRYERAEELAADDLDLLCAALERRLEQARDGGTPDDVERLERELEQAQSELEARAWDEEGAPEGDAAEPGRNDPCPCGSGMKYKRCCGSATDGPQSDAARVVALLEELMREADTPRLARVLEQALPRFAGEALAGRALGAALPLLPRDDLPEALANWAVLDCDLGDGTRVIERVLGRRRSAARERELFGRLADSAASAWRVELAAGGRDARLVDQLDAAADPVVLRDMRDLPHGAIVCARVLELDGEHVLGPGTIVLRGEEGERWLAAVRARLNELRAAEPELAWRAFLRRHAHELYRPLVEAP